MATLLLNDDEDLQRKMSLGGAWATLEVEAAISQATGKPAELEHLLSALKLGRAVFSRYEEVWCKLHEELLPFAFIRPPDPTPWENVGAPWVQRWDS